MAAPSSREGQRGVSTAGRIGILSLYSSGLKTVLGAAGLVVVIPALTFLLFALLPSDPIRLALGVNASEEAVARLRHELGYDRPLPLRLGTYLWGLARLDFGRSLVTRRPVAGEVLEAYTTTLQYVGVALGLSIVVSVALLGIAHVGGPRVRSPLLLLARAVISLPSLVVAIGVGLALLAAIGPASLVRADTRNLLMAGLALAVYPSLSLAEILILEREMALRLPHVRAARSFGFSKRRVFWSYMLRTVALPWLGHLSNVAASLVAGSIVVELVFSLSGLGRLVVQSVLRNDFPMMQAVVIVGVLTFLGLNALADRTLRKLYPAAR